LIITLPLSESRAKANAGFSMYARADELSKLRRVMGDRELIAEIMSL